MQAQFVGNFTQHQGPHGQRTVQEEVLLPLHDGVANPQNRVKPLLNVFDEPARLLQALLHGRVAGRIFATAPAFERRRINVMHAEPWHDLLVELHTKARVGATAGFNHNNVWNNDISPQIKKLATRFGFEVADEFNRLAHRQIVGFAGLHQALDVAPGQ